MFTNHRPTRAHSGWSLVSLWLVVLVTVPTTAQMTGIATVSLDIQQLSEARPADGVVVGELTEHDGDGRSLRDHGPTCQQAAWNEPFGL